MFPVPPFSDTRSENTTVFIAVGHRPDSLVTRVHSSVHEHVIAVTLIIASALLISAIATDMR